LYCIVLYIVKLAPYIVKKLMFQLQHDASFYYIMADIHKQCGWKIHLVISGKRLLNSNISLKSILPIDSQITFV